jgi:hypothetical protein
MIRTHRSELKVGDYFIQYTRLYQVFYVSRGVIRVFCVEFGLSTFYGKEVDLVQVTLTIKKEPT